MTYLLDTQAFLFAAFAPTKLSKKARGILVDQQNEILVSVVTFWEISLKYALGKLDLKGVGPDDMPEVSGTMGFTTLDLSASDASRVHELPPTAHKDPFDRMLIWQAIRQGHVLVSRDSSFGKYHALGLKTIW